MTGIYQVSVKRPNDSQSPKAHFSLAWCIALVILKAESRQYKRSPCLTECCLKWCLSCSHSPSKSAEESETIISSDRPFTLLTGKLHTFRKVLQEKYGVFLFLGMLPCLFMSRPTSKAEFLSKGPVATTEFREQRRTTQWSCKRQTLPLVKWTN